MLMVVFLCLCVCVLLLILDAVSSSHDPVGSNQRTPTSVPPYTIPLILQRDLETKKEQHEGYSWRQVVDVYMEGII